MKRAASVITAYGSTPQAVKELAMQWNYTNSEGVEYRVVPDFPEYCVGSDGSIWSIFSSPGCIGKEWREIKGEKMQSGHRRVTMHRNARGRRLQVHRVVLFAFIGIPPKEYECCHNNGIPYDNRIENLRWDTKESNNKDKIKHGVLRYGKDNPATKLDKGKIMTIREMRKNRISQLAIGNSVGVSQQLVSRVLANDKWMGF